MKSVIKVIAITMLMACSPTVCSIFGGGNDWIRQQAEDALKAKQAADAAAAAAKCNCLANGYCDGTDLTGCGHNLDHKVLHSLKGANLSGLTLSWVDFTGADLTNAKLINTIINPGVTFTQAQLINTDLTGVQILPATWNAPIANFSYANLTGATIDQNILKALVPTGYAVKGMIWPDGTCPDHRCSKNPNKKTVILSTIDNQSDYDYAIVTTDAPLDELLSEIDKSAAGTSQLTRWLTTNSPLISKTPSVSHTFSTGTTYSFRFLGEYNDQPVIAKAHTISQYPIGNNTFPDVSSEKYPTGTDAQTIILFPVANTKNAKFNFGDQCTRVHILGRAGTSNSEISSDFEVWTYNTYHPTPKRRCDPENTKDVTAVYLNNLPASKGTNLAIRTGGKLSLVIGTNGVRESITATAN
jgi:hypothetical protein